MFVVWDFKNLLVWANLYLLRLICSDAEQWVPFSFPPPFPNPPRNPHFQPQCLWVRLGADIGTTWRCFQDSWALSLFSRENTLRHPWSLLRLLWASHPSSPQHFWWALKMFPFHLHVFMDETEDPSIFKQFQQVYLDYIWVRKADIWKSTCLEFIQTLSRFGFQKLVGLDFLLTRWQNNYDNKVDHCSFS